MCNCVLASKSNFLCNVDRSSRSWVFRGGQTEETLKV